MSDKSPSQWKTQVYVIGLIIGALFGLMAALMYTRAAEEDVSRTGTLARIQTGDLLGMGLAALGILRQAAELGRTPESKKRRR
jgi:F0F1-type ATP synthase assembly protein I